MSTSFDLTKYYARKDGVIDYSPGWVLLVIPFEERITFSRKVGKSDPTKQGRKTKTPVIISTECLQMTFSATKSAHVTNLNTMLAGEQDYMSMFMPGDWCMAWMVTDMDRYRKIVDGLKKTTPDKLNGFHDGLKFMGKISSVRKINAVDPNSGAPVRNYSITAVGFDELDYMAFYEPRLIKQQIVPAQFEQLGLYLNSITSMEEKGVHDGGLIDPNKMIPKLAEALLGMGPYRTATSITTPDGGTTPASPTAATFVPEFVSQVMGVDNKNNTFRPLMDIIIGVQKYPVRASDAGQEGVDDTPLFSCPDGTYIEEGEAPVYKTGGSLKGQFSIAIPPVFNKPYWSILHDFLNAPLNEMYVAMKASPDEGKVRPTLVVRQYPFSSGMTIPITYLTNVDSSDPELAGNQLTTELRELPPPPQQGTETGRGDHFTPFTSLPRWKVSQSITSGYDIGRSNALRHNYVYVDGVPAVGTGVDAVNQFVRCPPMRDDEDILRNGLRPYTTTVNCTYKDVVSGPVYWRNVMADIVMGQHLTMTGTMTLMGIDLPICPGDNIEFEGVIFHIESVSHMCRVAGVGHKVFQTTLQLTNGVKAKPPTEDAEIYAEVDVALSQSLGETTLPNIPTNVDPNSTAAQADALSVRADSLSKKLDALDKAIGK